MVSITCNDDKINSKTKQTRDSTEKILSGTKKNVSETKKITHKQDSMSSLDNSRKDKFNKEEDNRITAIKNEFREWKEKVRDSVIILVDREDARLIDEATKKYEFTGEKAIALLPFYTSRYSSTGQKIMQKNIENRINTVSSGVFLTLTFDPSKYTLLEAWENLSRLIKHALNYLKILKKRDSKKHGKDSKLEYVWVVEAQKNGYPHVHVFFLGIQYLLPQIKVAAIWNAGFVFLQKMENVNIGRYMTKYLAKNQGLPDVLPFVWKFKIRMYGMTNMTTVKKETKEVDYVVIGTCSLKELEGFAWGNNIHQIEFWGSSGGGITINAFPLRYWQSFAGQKEGQGCVSMSTCANLPLTFLVALRYAILQKRGNATIPF